VRRYPVQDFDHYLVFYRAVEGGVDILHVYHGARDIPALLDESPEDDT
jgi:plasmid stabilization system protein ParE